jgi:hypothetical protein
MMLWRRIRCYKIDAVQSYPSLRDEEEDQDKGQHIEPGVKQERSGRSDGSQKGRECEAECTPDGVVDADGECFRFRNGTVGKLRRSKWKG